MTDFKSGLSAAIWTDDPSDGPLRQIEIDVPEHGLVVIAHCQVIYLQKGRLL